MKYRNALM